MQEELRDETKVGKWIFRHPEDILRPRLLRHVPKQIETYHLTLFTIIWTAIAILASWLSMLNINFLWITCLAIIAQYITDLLDGTVGRERNTGLVKWGHYMDHVLDFIFFTSLALCFGFVFPSAYFTTIVIVAFIQAGFMVSMFLNYSATDKLGISFAFIGPTEIRLLYLLAYSYIALFGTSLIEIYIPYLAYCIGLLLVFFIYKTQKKIWQIDMSAK